jgi:hypothetical protein
MILPKTPIRDIDLDEFAQQLREFESLRAKSSTLGASEYPQTENARTIGGKNRKSIRENPRDQPAPASSVRPRQKSMRGSARKANIDDVERQLREVASSALRKSPPPPKKGDLLVARVKQPGGTLGRRIDAEAAAAGATSHRGLMQMASWRPVILQTYSERSAVSRCARSLALPLLLLSLGAGTLVVLSPEGALTDIDHSLEDAASPGSPSSARVSPGETSAFKPRDAAEMVPVRVADDDQRQSPSALSPTSPSPTRRLLDAGAAPAAAPSAQGEVVGATGSANAVIAPPSGALPGGIVSGAPLPVTAGLATPQAPISLPAGTPSRPDAAASSSFAVEPNGSNPGSSGDAVSEAPASVLAALARPEGPPSLPAVTPSPTPDEVASPSLAAKLIEPKSGSNSEAVSEAPASVAAGLATPQASITLPTVTPSPTADAAASSSLAIESKGSDPGSSRDAVSEAPTSVLAALPTPEASTSLPAVAPSPTPDEAVSPSLAAKWIEPKSGSNSQAVSEAPAPVVAGLTTPQASTSLPAVTPSPTPDAAASPSIAIETRNSNPGSSGDAVSEAPASVLAALATSEVPKPLPTVTPSPRSDDAAPTNAEIVASVPLLAATSLPTPPEVSPSGAADRVASRLGSTDEANSQVSSSAMADLATLQAPASLLQVTGSPAPDGAASSKTENIASGESIHSRPRSDGETGVGTGAPLATQEAPASPPPAASPPNTFAQVTPGTPIERTKPPVAHLIVAQRESGAAGAALPLPVSLSSVPAGAMIVIHGLAAGSTLTEGRALETGSWQLTARELHDAVLRPPQGFAGAMELGLELRLPNDNVADRKTLHLEWTASAGSQATRPAFVIRQLGSDEVAALLKRGEGFIASGDLASARLVLQRAAEAGEAQAALSLAGTFDPIVLDKLGLQGQKADIEKARIWYQRAQELGSAAAPRRLQLLAGYDQ